MRAGDEERIVYLPLVPPGGVFQGTFSLICCIADVLLEIHQASLCEMVDCIWGVCACVCQLEETEQERGNGEHQGHGDLPIR